MILILFLWFGCRAFLCIPFGLQVQDSDGKDIVSNLRSGAAAENAFAIMQEKGLSNPRRYRHRLTPGTVKYAAFHVLSLEGSRGLNILEVADKIQVNHSYWMSYSLSHENY